MCELDVSVFPMVSPPPMLISLIASIPNGTRQALGLGPYTAVDSRPFMAMTALIAVIYNQATLEGTDR